MDFDNETEQELNAAPAKSSKYIIAVFLMIISLVFLSRSTKPNTSKHGNPLNDAVVLYSYEESPLTRINAEFFIRHALHSESDFIFILNGPTDLATLIPTESNIKVIQSEKKACFGLGVFSQVLKANNNAVVNKYNRFILMNALIRGPFVPHWSRACWSSAYLGRLTDKVKLVGMSYNCHIARHVQSMIWATDSVGMQLLLSPRTLGSCWRSESDALQAELYATQHVLDAGYEVDVMLSAFQASPRYSRTCDNGDPLFEGAYFGITPHLYETMFFRTDRGTSALDLSLHTQWTDQMEYSSYTACQAAM